MNVTDKPSLTNRDLSRLLAAGAIIGPCCEIMLNEVFQGYPVSQVDPESFGFRYIEGFGDFPTTTLTQEEWLAITEAPPPRDDLSALTGLKATVPRWKAIYGSDDGSDGY